MRLLTLLVVLGVFSGLACAPKHKGQTLLTSQAANIIPIQPNPGQIVGPVYVPPITQIFLSIEGTQNKYVALGNYEALTVRAEDGSGNPVVGAYASFASVNTSSVFGLGTATTDAAGRATVFASPVTAPSVEIVECKVIKGPAISNVVTFSVTGR